MRDRSASPIAHFQTTLEEAGLVYLGYKGKDFTWYNGRERDRAIWERLDRLVANEAWRNIFPRLEVHHRSSTYFDHSPFVALLKGRKVVARCK